MEGNKSPVGKLTSPYWEGWTILFTRTICGTQKAADSSLIQWPKPNILALYLNKPNVLLLKSTRATYFGHWVLCSRELMHMQHEIHLHLGLSYIYTIISPYKSSYRREGNPYWGNDWNFNPGNVGNIEQKIIKSTESGKKTLYPYDMICCKVKPNKLQNQILKEQFQEIYRMQNKHAKYI